MRDRRHADNRRHLLGMLGLWHRRPDAGLKVESRELAISIFDVGIRNRLQIPQSKHGDVGLRGPADQDRFLELNLTQETLRFEEIPGAIPNRGLLRLPRWCSYPHRSSAPKRMPGNALERPPNDIETAPRPGPLQAFE
jgi:hypothetical protein